MPTSVQPLSDVGNGDMVTTEAAAPSGLASAHRSNVQRKPDSTQPAALELRAVSKSYAHLTVLKPTNLTVGPAEFVTLLGPSGSGKTTILNIAAGIVRPDSGQIFAHGTDVTKTAMHQRNIGMVFQRYTLFPNKTVSENVAFPLGVRKVAAKEAQEKVKAFLSLVGLSSLADRYPSEISGGQAQRVALARALVFEPDLLLMDEPLGALDRRLRQTLQDEIRRIQQETKVPTLYVTHDQEEAMTLSDRIVIARDGEIVANDNPRGLYHSPPSLWAAEFLGDSNSRHVERIDRLASGEGIAVTTCGLRLRTRMHSTSLNGDQLVVAIRPEDCHLSKAPISGHSNYKAELLALTFVGPFQQATVRLESGWQLKALVHGRSDFEIGEHVWCHWGDTCPIVVPA